MRWHILRTLLGKEIRRQLANRGGIVLAALLVVAALLLTLFRKGEEGALTGGVEYCFVDYRGEDAWVRHLRDHVPGEYQGRIKFRDLNRIWVPQGQLVYPPGSGAIQMQPVNGRLKVWVWQPREGSLAPFEAWFWRESARYFQQHTAALKKNDSVNVFLAKRRSALSGNGKDAETPAEILDFETEKSHLEGGVDMRSSITSALILFALFFSCVYLLPSLMCEERERGVLLAQALSPASPGEILAAKFLFYPLVGMALAATLAGIARPAVLGQLFFWLVLLVAACGSLGIGLTIASVARTQRIASMGALCYMLVVAMFLFICQQGNIPALPYFALEYHCPRMLHATLSHTVQWFHWANLVAAAILATGWAVLAALLFRQRGWQ